MSLEDYIQSYLDLLKTVRFEAYVKHKDEANMLFEFIDNWPDLIPKNEEHHLIQSISGMLLLNSFKLTNGISFEILSGKYFEAIRNLRFIFEGAILSVIIESVVEPVVDEKWNTLTGITLKAEIFNLMGKCKGAKVFQKRQLNQSKIREIVEKFVFKNMPQPSITREEYVEVYVKILSHEILYLSTSKMIVESSKILKLDEKYMKKLLTLWHRLSARQHFSSEYMYDLLEKPDFCFTEVFYDELFTISLDHYFHTLDVFYSVLAWRFPHLRPNITEVCKWWNDNFDKRFVLTEKTISVL